MQQDEGTNIDTEHLHPIEYFLSQSIQGVHLLFDNPTLAKILKTPSEEINYFTSENLNKAQEILKKFIKQQSYYDKISFLEKLNSCDFELFVRTYFHIVENTILNTDWKH